MSSPNPPVTSSNSNENPESRNAFPDHAEGVASYNATKFSKSATTIHKSLVHYTNDFLSASLSHGSEKSTCLLAISNLRAAEPLVVNDNLAELAPYEAKTFQAIGIAATMDPQ